MKVRVSSLLASFVAIFLMAFNAQAQEELPMLETQDPGHQELNLNEDKILLYDHSSNTGQTKDTEQVAPAKSNVVRPAKNLKPEVRKNNPQEREGEDVLSFNILYYMFQKYKMTDLKDK